MRYLTVIILSLLSTNSFGQPQVWSLDSCIAYAFEHNIALQQSALNVSLAEINQQTAVGGLLPNLNAQASHGYNWGQRIDQFTNQFASERIRSNNLGIATSVNLFNGFQQVNAVRQANLQIERSKADLDKMKNDIALNVASSFLTVLLNKEFLDIAKSNRDNSEAQARRLEKLVAVGQQAEGNLNDMLARLASDEASLVSAENSYNLSKLALMQLLMLNTDQMDNFELEIPDLDDTADSGLMNNPNALVQAALANFPEVKSSTLNVAGNDVGLKIARGAMLPSISASASYGTGYSGAARVLTGDPELVMLPIGYVQTTQDIVLAPQLNYGSDDFTLKPFDKQLKDNVNQSLFFTLSVPIFNGFNTRAGIKRAEVNLKNAELQLDQTKQTLEQSVRRAAADAKAAYATYDASKKSVEANQKAFDWNKVRYENGLLNATDYNASRIQLDNARATETRSKYDFLFKTKVLEFYQGRPISLKK